KDRKHNARRRDARLRRASLDSRPCFGLDRGDLMSKARVLELGGILRHRELRRGREIRKTLTPVIPRATVELRLFYREVGEHVIAERELERRQRLMRVLVVMQELAAEYPVALRIADQQIVADVKSRHRLAVTSRAQLEQRPPVAWQHFVRHRLSDLLKFSFYFVAGSAAQVQHFNGERRDIFKNLLSAVVKHKRAQHIVTIDKLLPRKREFFHVEFVALKLKIRVRRYISQFKRAGSANPVRLLHGGERKRLVSLLKVRDYLGKKHVRSRL